MDEDKIKFRDQVIAILRDKDGNIKQRTEASDLITTLGWDLLCSLVAKTLTVVTAESVGTGDGSTKTFTLDNKAAIDIVGKVGGVAKGLESVDNEEGTITFETAPASGSAITADYEYFSEGWKAFYIAIGTGNTAPTTSDTILESEITTGGGQRKIGTYVSATGSKIWDLTTVYDFTASFSVNETGILNASSGGTLLSRQVFDLTFNAVNGDKLEIIWKFTLT